MARDGLGKSDSFVVRVVIRYRDLRLRQFEEILKVVTVLDRPCPIRITAGLTVLQKILAQAHRCAYGASHRMNKISKAASLLGSIGNGASKARTTEQARHAANCRWAKHKTKRAKRTNKTKP